MAKIKRESSRMRNKIFKKTSARTNSKNLRTMARGGTRL